MSFIYRPQAHIQSGENGWNMVSAPKDLVDCIELDATAGLTSATIPIPNWTGYELNLSFKIAIEGPATANLANVGFFAGLTSTHAKRWGQAGEYCVGCTHTARTGSWTATTAATTAPVANQAYQWTASLGLRIVNAGVFTSYGAASIPIPRVDQDFGGGGTHQSHGNHSWSWISLNFRRGTPNWRVQMDWLSSSREWCTKRDFDMLGFDNVPGTTWHTRQVARALPLEIFGGDERSTVNSASVPVDEVAHGLMNRICFAWTQPTYKAFIRHICVSAQRGFVDGVFYPNHPTV